MWLIVEGVSAQKSPADSLRFPGKDTLKREIQEKKSQLLTLKSKLDSLDRQLQAKNKLIADKERSLQDRNTKIRELGEKNKTYLTGFRWVAALILVLIIFFLSYGIWYLRFNRKIPKEIRDRYPLITDPFMKGIFRKYITYLKLSRLATMLLFLFVSIAVLLFSYVVVVVVFNDNFNNVDILVNNKFWDFILASGFPLAFVTVVYNTVETKRAEVETFIMDKLIERENRQR